MISGPPIELVVVLSVNWFAWGLLSDYWSSLPTNAQTEPADLEKTIFLIARWLSVSLAVVPFGVAAVRASLSEVVALAVGVPLFVFATYAPLAFLFFGAPSSRYGREAGPLFPSSVRTQGYAALLLFPLIALWMFASVVRRYGGIAAA
jgi:hypothetical protein